MEGLPKGKENVQFADRKLASSLKSLPWCGFITGPRLIGNNSDSQFLVDHMFTESQALAIKAAYIFFGGGFIPNLKVQPTSDGKISGKLLKIKPQYFFLRHIKI